MSSLLRESVNIVSGLIEKDQDKRVSELESKIRKLLNEQGQQSVITNNETTVQAAAVSTPRYASLTDPNDMTSAGSWIAWTFATQLSSGVTTTSSKMTILEAGDYLVNINMFFQSSGNSTYVDLYTNGVASGGAFYSIPDYIRNDSNIYAVSLSGIVSLSLNDYLEFKMMTSSGTTYGNGGGFTITKVS